MKTKYAKELLSFIKHSPSCYHVIENFKTILIENGYSELCESDTWSLKAGEKYFITRYDSSIVSFKIPKNSPSAFIMAAAHSDSPTFKIKENAEKAAGSYVKLETEKYGGMLMSTWFDRPLSVAGRIVVKCGDKLSIKLVDIDRDLLIIPNVAIHMNRTANDGIKYAANIDTIPLFGSTDSSGKFMEMVAKAAGVKENEILGTDLFLYSRDNGTLLGAQKEYIASPKLDDLECAYACMKGFINAKESDAISVCCIFDNEEVGSETKQGAASSFLRDTLRRIAISLGLNEEKYQLLRTVFLFRLTMHMLYIPITQNLQMQTMHP